MRTKYKIYKGLLIFCATFFSASCTKYFDEINTDPNSVVTITPESIFANACIYTIHDFEYFYDYYRDMMPWMQLWVPSNGNVGGFLNNLGNFNYRYDRFYGSVGVDLTEAQHLIDNMPDDKKAAYVYERTIAQIVKVYYGWYVSDINGDIVYTEAFEGRYGGTRTPKYDTQDSLFTIWDQQLKEAITTLKAPQSVQQVSYGNYDVFYGGDVNKWIRCAATLRLKIAMRLMKRDPERMKGIVNEVIAAGNLMQSDDDSWIYVTGPGATGPGGGSNWNPAGFKAPKPMVDFMWNTGDPRMALFFQKNDYDSATFVLAQSQGKLSAGSKWNSRQYVGMVVSPDEVKTPAGQALLPRTKITDAQGQAVTLDTTSFVQYRLWQAEYPDAGGTPGSGNTAFVYLTYSDECFMRAELAARGYTSEDAEAWYNKGITASIKMYDKLASIAQIFNYKAVSDAQIQAYLSNPVIKYDPSKGVEQIASQALINFFKQANEAWALYKRTGLPNNQSDLPHVDFISNGTVGEIPRRAVFNIPAEGQPNFENRNAALQHMESDPDYGSGPSDFHGRVWWDKKE